MTPFTNIHIAPAAPAVEPDQTPRLPRLRTLTNDPAREYAQRAGEVERLPDSIAAMILCKKGFSKVQRNGIRVDGVLAKTLNFWSEDSVTIAEKAGTNEKVLWVLNRLQPDLLHILKPSGEYVETIPLEGKVPWFDAAATEEILSAKRRSQNRSIERVRLLHSSDSEAAADAANANDAAMKSAVHTFPTDRQPSETGTRRTAHVINHQSGDLSSGQRPNTSGCESPETVELPSRAEGRARSSARGAFAKADRIHEIQRDLQGQRTAHATRVQTLERRVAAITPEDLDDLTNDDGVEPAAALTATGWSPEEGDASDDIL